MMDITWFEETWDKFINDDAYNCIGRLNLSACMGERVGFLLQEIRMLRTQVEGLRAALEEEKQGAANAWRLAGLG